MSGRFSIDEILREALFADPNGRHGGSNLVDALFAIATSLNGVSNAIRYLGDGDAAIQRQLEAHTGAMYEAAEDISSALGGVAEAIANASRQ